MNSYAPGVSMTDEHIAGCFALHGVPGVGTDAVPLLIIHQTAADFMRYRAMAHAPGVVEQNAGGFIVVSAFQAIPEDAPATLVVMDCGDRLLIAVREADGNAVGASDESQVTMH